MEGSMFKTETLDEFMRSVDIKNNELKARSAVVSDIFAKQAEEGKKIEEAIQSKGDNSAIVLRAKETADLQTQTNVLNQAAKMGIAPGVDSSVLDKVADEWKQAKLASIDKQQKLAKDLDVKFFEHPLDYVVAQVKMEGTITEAERAAARSGEATRNFADIQQLTQHLPGQMAALAATKSQATLDATMAENAAMTNAAVSKARIENAGIQVQGIQALNNMSAQELNNKHTALSVKQQAEQFELQKKQFAQSTEMFKMQMEDRLERMNQKKMDRDELESQANVVRKGAAVAGFEGVAAYPTNKIIQMLNMRDAKTMDFFKAGMATEATGHPILGEDAGQVAKIINQHLAPLRPEQATIKTFYQEVWSEASSPEGGLKGRYDPTKLDQVTNGATKIAINKAASQMGNIKTGDNTNIYAAPPLQNVLDLGPVKNTAWAAKVMAPQMVTGELKEFNPQQLASLTAEAVRSGKINFKEAAEGLQSAFTGSVELNNRTKNFKGMGLPEQVGFTTSMNDGGSIKKYNLTQAQDVNKILSKLLIISENSANPMRVAGPHD